uniref:biotin synthase n=1 Tax=Daucus carota subsp. sativus TaxID=79200 RepID=A0A175YGP9_DAUCS
MSMMRLIRANTSSCFLLSTTARTFSTSSASASASAAAIEAERSIKEGGRNNWSRDEIKSVYDSPILDLLFHAAQVHRHAHNFREVQQCTLLSVKTGGCSEDCAYCPQSSRYNTGVKSQKLLSKDAVLEAALKAKEAGSTRFCMGAAWRDTVGRKTNFKQILEYVKEIRGMGMEVCCTLGMIEKQQAEELKEAGLTAYNHNLDTSREYYPNIITTRSYDERLETLKHVREAGINVCSGGIIGLGEAEDDRVGLLHTLATLPTHPESVPINALLAMKGTPLEEQKPVEVWEMIRMIASARITMPKAMVRLSAGRVKFTIPEQALCFLAGANSIFTGDKLLTTPNNDFDADQQMFKLLGLIPKAPDFSNDAKGKDFEAENLQGHINPMLQFSKRLASKGLMVTLAATSTISKSLIAEHDGPVKMVSIPDGSQGLSTQQWDSSLAESKEASDDDSPAARWARYQPAVSQGLIELIERHNKESPCNQFRVLIYDSMMPWCLDIAHRLGLKGASFFTQSGTVSLLYHHAHVGTLQLPSDGTVVSVPQLSVPLEVRDLPSFIYDTGANPAIVKTVTDQFSNFKRADWLLFNTFDKLEDQVSFLLAKHALVIV